MSKEETVKWQENAGWLDLCWETHRGEGRGVKTMGDGMGTLQLWEVGGCELMLLMIINIWSKHSISKAPPPPTVRKCPPPHFTSAQAFQPGQCLCLLASIYYCQRR